MPSKALTDAEVFVLLFSSRDPAERRSRSALNLSCLPRASEAGRGLNTSRSDEAVTFAVDRGTSAEPACFCSLGDLCNPIYLYLIAARVSTNGFSQKGQRRLIGRRRLR
ncbi:hypothetical protein KC323_g57 [Hortaea werneckii]|nr:hypothetical protein KC323_g57 [Hortaea werneckii]